MVKRRLWLILLLIFGVSILYSGAQLYAHHLRVKEANRLQESLNNLEEREPEVGSMSLWPAQASLESINPHVKAWISIPGTKVDYPVVQTSDNDYYLNHDFNRNRSVYGTIFADAKNDLSGKDSVLLLYGHHMNDGRMFGDLIHYTDPAFWKEHPVVEYTDAKGTRRYEIFAVLQLSVREVMKEGLPYYNQFSFPFETDFQGYMEEVQSKSLYSTGIEAAFGDSILVMSTCEYSVDDGRLLVLAKCRAETDYDKEKIQ